MKVVHVAHRYDYGKPERGLSFEHYNFYETLVAMGHDTSYVDIGAGGGGPGSADALLHASVERERPDVVFCLLFGDEVSPEALGQVTTSGVPTVNWFADDHWRFADFTSRYAPHVSLAATTDRESLPEYERIGARAVLTQWAAATQRYRPTPGPLRYDVTLVGQVYGERPGLVAALRADGVDVRTWGTGWGVRRHHWLLGTKQPFAALGGARLLSRVQASTRADQDEMIRIFGTSRVNLNPTEASHDGVPQIKGRTFEVPACGGLLLTGPALHLEDYYVPGEEVVVFDDVDDMRAKARWLLDHDDERRRIAEAGHARTVAEHTYEKRLGAIFAALGA
ncbi:spore maturation protein CgeB [Motilibacter rhizosphaerae]|uniref:Spore maturation protein CgeB n=1 Tax=Motilibacter rhizosphaerae TaxID=598652 RepID=A0A4Q7NVV5_9ACTN|nr:glycosyltransferase [Motilibacter rhizosphaerae]RZS91284.1 spore maturation protein CgeB [Motilibacter rhizosphaerae]